MIFRARVVGTSNMNPHAAIHLPESERIKFGAFYTPSNIVQKVIDLITPYCEKNKGNVVIADVAAGCGAFLFPVLSLGVDYRVADYDEKAITFLQKYFHPDKVFYTNSLLNVCREKFNIRKDQYLIIVGNPPYNDVTSLYRKGRKGSFECDRDLYDRDLGISFLKAFAKLDADVVCILHPLSYLIKEVNFKRLKGFRDKYRLKAGYIFSSSVFRFTKTARFPVIVALYEKDNQGMDYSYIKTFRFKFLEGRGEFVLGKFTTTDGYINKYPPRKGEPQFSPIGVYFYSFRDLNSLLRNATFLREKKDNAIVVTVESFYKYAYLYCLKKFITQKREDIWVFGNLSPLVNREFLEQNKSLFVFYAIKNHKIFEEKLNVVNVLKNFYQIDEDKISLDEVEKALSCYFNELYRL